MTTELETIKEIVGVGYFEQICEKLKGKLVYFPKPNDTLKDKIIELYKQDKTATEIKDEVNCNIRHVYWAIAQYKKSLGEDI